MDQFYYASVRAGRRQGSPDRRRQRRRLRHSRLHPVASSGERRAAVALVHRAAEEGRSRRGDLAERGSGAARRRDDVDADHLRSRSSTTSTSRPATRSRSSPTRTGRATTCSPDRSSRSNADTGKMVWYFQSSPHDTHDWDSTQTAVLIDDEVNGQKRKLIAQAARNGHYFLLDRATGKALVSAEYVKTNWAKGYDAKGQPIPDPAKMPQLDGALVSPNSGGGDQLAVAELQPADRAVLRERGAGVQHLLPLRPERQPDGVGRLRSRRLVGVDDPGDRLQDREDPLDAPVGRQRAHRAREHRRQRALLRRARRTTSSRSTPRTGGRCGTPILNGTITNGPITYELDGRQYVVAAAGDTLWAFVLNPRPSMREGASPRADLKVGPSIMTEMEPPTFRSARMLKWRGRPSGRPGENRSAPRPPGPATRAALASQPLQQRRRVPAVDDPRGGDAREPRVRPRDVRVPELVGVVRVAVQREEAAGVERLRGHLVIQILPRRVAVDLDRDVRPPRPLRIRGASPRQCPRACRTSGRADGRGCGRRGW